MENIETVRRELLTYLAQVPKTLDENGPDCAGQIAVSLGNALLWLHGILDPDGPRMETPIGETPMTIYALGKQLRAVGLKHWDAKNRAGKSRVESLEKAFLTVCERLTRLEGGSR